MVSSLSPQLNLWFARDYISLKMIMDWNFDIVTGRSHFWSEFSVYNIFLKMESLFFTLIYFQWIKCELLYMIYFNVSSAKQSRYPSKENVTLVINDTVEYG